MAISKTEESLLIRLHEAQTVQAFGTAVFNLLRRCMISAHAFLALRPVEFELPCFCSDLKYKAALDDYIARDHKCDVWLKRSPVSPRVTAVRHSDYTPTSLLRRTKFYKKVLNRLEAEHGASMVAWRRSVWLATLTVFRTREQGDFSDEDMECLKRWQPHFASAIRRFAGWHESRLAGSSLEEFIWALPTPAVVLDWDLDVLHHNSAAEDICLQWSLGRQRMTQKKQRFCVPGDILAALQRYKPRLEQAKTNRPDSPRRLPAMVFKHRFQPGLEVKINFLPSKALSVSRGTFLLQFDFSEETVDEPTVYRKLALLTRRERECVRFACQGKTNRGIAQELGTSRITVRNQLNQVYRKLRLGNRYELLSVFGSESKVAL